jgi:hypothetical protein
VANFPLPKDLGDDVARLGASSNGPRRRAGGVPTLLFGLARRGGGASRRMGCGLPVGVLVTPGQTSDYVPAEALVEGRARR